MYLQKQVLWNRHYDSPTTGKIFWSKINSTNSITYYKFFVFQVSALKYSIDMYMNFGKRNSAYKIKKCILTSFYCHNLKKKPRPPRDSF
jgi:hypothetical protein